MKKLFLPCCFALLFCLNGYGQTLTYRSIHISGRRATVNAAILANGNAYFAGSADSLAYVLCETDSGTTAWLQLTGRTGKSSATGLQTSGDGVVLSCGYVPQATGNKVYTIQAFSATGAVVAALTLNDSLADDYASGITELLNSGYVITGMGPGGMGVILLSSHGVPLSGQAFSPAMPDHNQRVLPISNGGFLISCNNNAPANGLLPDFRLLRFDSTAHLLQSEKFKVSRGISVYAMSKTNDMGIIVAGSYVDSNAHGIVNNLMLAKISSLGAVTWAYTYTGAVSTADAFHSVVQTDDGGYAAYGSVGGAAYGGSDNVLLKTDPSGNAQWAKTYGLYASDSGMVVSLTNQGYFLAGYGYDNTGSYIEFITTDSTGNTSCHFDSLHLNKNAFSLTADTINLTSKPLTGFDVLTATTSPGTATMDSVVCPGPFVYHHLLDTVNFWYYGVNMCGMAPPPNTGGGNGRSLSTCGDPAARGIVYTGGDTIYNNYTYKQLNVAFNFNVFTHTYPDSCYIGLIREDTLTGKVYFFGQNDSIERVLYNFSMQVGQSIPVTFFVNQGSGYWQSGIYTLDSIDNFNTISGLRKQYHLSCHTCSNSHPLTWVEGVGNLADAIYTENDNLTFGCGPYMGLTGFQHSRDYFVTCFYHHQKVYFDSAAYIISSAHLGDIYWDVVDSCTAYYIVGGIQKLTTLSSFTAYPNPTNNQVTLELNVAENAGFDIYVKDIEGKTISNHLALGRLNPGLHHAALNVSDLSPGFYLVECRTTAGSLYSKLVVQR